MSDRLVILDKNRKAVLSLPAPALQLWLCYWMNEDEVNESYVSIAEIEEQSGMRMSRRTIIRWTSWLLENGWLVDTGKTAAEKFHERGRPVTRGAYQVRVYKVDDPTSAKSAPVQKTTPDAELPTLPEEFTSANLAPVTNRHQCQNFTGANGTQGSSSCSGSGFDSRSRSNATPASIAGDGGGSLSGSPALRGQEENSVPTPNQNSEPTARTKTSKPKPPQGFDLWPLEQRLAWSEANRSNGGTNGAGKSEPTVGTGNARTPLASSLSTKNEGQEQPLDRCRNGCSANIMIHEDSGLCVMCYEDSLNPANLS